MYQTQPTNPAGNLGGGAAIGRGFQPSRPEVHMVEVGGIPSLQYADYWDQNYARPPFRMGEQAWYPKPPALAGAQMGRGDRFLGHMLMAPIIPRGIPATTQITIQRGFGNSTHEFIGLRAPRLNEGAGCNAAGSQFVNAYGG